MKVLSFFKKIIIIFIYSLIIVTAILLGALIGLYYQTKRHLPDLSVLKDYKPSQVTRLYSSNGELIANFSLEKRIIVPYSSIPYYLVQATIAVEDAHFYKHHGLDWEGITRAFVRNLKQGYFAEGGSTITQQLTRSILLHSEKTIMRKFKEVLIALELEKVFSKEQIIDMYLNQIYFGNGAYGVESAARTFFGKHIEEITLEEAALLASLPKAPNTYNPYRYPDRAQIRRDYVLKRMLEEGYIDFNSYQKALNTPISLQKRTERFTSSAYFVEYVRKYLEDKYGATTLYRGGLKVYTTLDLNTQESAEKALIWGIEELDKRQGFRKITDSKPLDDKEKEEIKKGLASAIETNHCPSDLFRGEVIEVSANQASIRIEGTELRGVLNLEDALWTKAKSLNSILKKGDTALVKIIEVLPSRYLKLALGQKPEVQGALVALDPRTGQIKAMVGGYDFKTSKYNRAVQARRQPGSAFKPFIYTTAIKKGYTLADIFIDSPIIYQDGITEKNWKPANYYQKFYGPTTLREALEKSRNIITIKLLKEIGIETSIETATKMGITSPLTHDLSLALGSSGVSLLDLTSAYGVFATGGIKVKPTAIIKIEGPDGQILEENTPQPERVLDEQTAYIMIQALCGVVEHGTGWRAKSLGRPIAGKTGTTNNYVDAWFIGFTSDFVAGTWVGFDEYKPLGNKETGSKAAAPIWVRFMQDSLNNQPIKDFPVPEGITTVPIDIKTGLLATPKCPAVFYETFIKGTEPQKACKAHDMTSSENFFDIDMDLSNRESYRMKSPRRDINKSGYESEPLDQDERDLE